MSSKLKHLDLNLLKALSALLDEQNVTRAAAQLSVTQSAMSGMLARLRESFGDPLFVRTQYGILPTERARELNRPLKALLAAAEDLVMPPEFDPQQANLTLKIGATDYGFYSIAVPFLAALKRHAPHIRTVLLPIQSIDIAAELAKGGLDFALITLGESAPDFHTRTLYNERYVCAMRAGHPAAQHPMDLDLFCRLDHAITSYRGCSFSGVTDAALEKLGRHRRVGLSVGSFLLLPEILLKSDWIAVVPERLVRGRKDLFVCEPPLEIQGFTKLLAWHERTHHHAAHRWLRALLAESCAAV